MTMLKYENGHVECPACNKKVAAPRSPNNVFKCGIMDHMRVKHPEIKRGQFEEQLKQIGADYVRTQKETALEQKRNCLLYTSPSPRDRG